MLILAAIALLFLLLYLQATDSETGRLIDPRLPTFFRSYYWLSVLLMIVGVIVSSVAFGRSLHEFLAPNATGGPLDDNWVAMMGRLAQARIDLPRQRVHVLLAPNEAGESLAGNLIRSADMRVVTVAPEGPATSPRARRPLGSGAKLRRQLGQRA